MWELLSKPVLHVSSGPGFEPRSCRSFRTAVRFHSHYSTAIPCCSPTYKKLKESMRLGAPLNTELLELLIEKKGLKPNSKLQHYRQRIDIKLF